MQHVSIRLSEKDVYLKGFVKLVRSRGAILSRYCSFAIQYFIRNRTFAHIADITDNTEDQTGVYINLTIEDNLIKAISEAAAGINISRGKMIKIILLNGINRSDKEYLMPEEEILKQLIIPVADTVSIKETVRNEEANMQPTKSNEVTDKSGSSTIEKTESIKKISDVKPQNTLLNNFFPSIMEQTADWD